LHITLQFKARGRSDGKGSAGCRQKPHLGTENQASRLYQKIQEVHNYPDQMFAERRKRIAVIGRHFDWLEIQVVAIVPVVARINAAVVFCWRSISFPAVSHISSIFFLLGE